MNLHSTFLPSKKPKRFLFLLTQDLASPSGLGRYLPLAKELAVKGHTVRIAATHSDFEHLTQPGPQMIDGISVSYVAQMHVQKTGNQKTYFGFLKLFQITASATYRLARAAISQPVDFILVGKPHPMNSMAGWLGRLRWNCTLIVDLDDDEEASGHFKAQWQRGLLGWFQNHVPKTARLVSTNTHYMQQKLQKMGVDPRKIIYLPNGVDRERFAQPSQPEIDRLRDRLQLKDKKVVLFIGSLSLTTHPVNLLIDAFATVAAAQNNAVLLLVGGGESLEALRKQVRDNNLDSAVIFCGRVDPMTVKNYYALADVSLDPTYDNDVARGRCPLKLFESWMCGVPFITTDIGDRPILAGAPPAAFLVKAGNPAEMAQAILKLLNDPGLAGQLRSAGLERSEQYTWESLADQFDQEISRRIRS